MCQHNQLASCFVIRKLHHPTDLHSSGNPPARTDSVLTSRPPLLLCPALHHCIHTGPALGTGRSEALTALLCCGAILLSLSVPNLPLRQRCPSIGCEVAVHDKAAKESCSLPFLGTEVKPPVHETHQTGTLKKGEEGEAKALGGEIEFLLRQGSYVSQASPQFTK